MDGDQLMLLGFAIAVGPWVVLFFVGIVGPVGWTLLGGTVFLIGLVAKYREEPESGTAVSGVNCPDCGARNDADDDACHHCGTALGSAGSAETW